jgi:uncharacterized surface protein with fasciclin (FAS1) repeats
MTAALRICCPICLSTRHRIFLYSKIILNPVFHSRRNPDHREIIPSEKLKEIREMKIFLAMMVLALGAAFGSTQALAQTGDGNPMVGGAAMYKTKDIVDNAVNSKDHTTLVAAVQAAGLVDTLKSKGPFTVFAPVNSAFAALPAGTVETLLKPENKATLAKILTYHVVSGSLDSKAVAKAIKAGNGKAELTTVAGGKLWAMMDGKNVVIMDEKGGKAVVTTADVFQSNGVIHVINAVLLPN